MYGGILRDPFSIGIGPGAGPYGVAFGSYAWVVDPGPQELIKVDLAAST